MSQASGNQQRHPIRESIFEEAYSFLPEPQNPEFYQQHLDTVQDFLEANKLKHWIELSKPNQLPTLEMTAVTDWGCAFVGHEHDWWDDILDEVGIEDVQTRRLIKDVHELQIEAASRDLEGPPDDYEFVDHTGEWEGYVVRKSKAWRDAEEAVTEELRWLVDVGCTAPQALDYWMCERWDKKQQVWGHWRGVKQPTVSENIDRAKSVIENTTYRPEISDEQEQARKEAYEMMERMEQVEIDVDVEEE